MATRDAMLRMNSRELSGLSPEERLERLEGVRTVNHHTFEQRHTLASGEVRDVEVHLSLSKSGDRGLIYTIVHDITERKRASAALAYQALHDGLTSLPNRELLHTGLQQAVKAEHNGGPPVALLLLDLDRFKEVNDTLGHQVGDLLLQHIAQRLQGAVRAEALVARLGGDEFAVVLPGTDSNAATNVAEVLVRVVQAPLVLGGQSIAVDASIGIAATPEHARDADSCCAARTWPCIRPSDRGAAWRCTPRLMTSTVPTSWRYSDELRKTSRALTLSCPPPQRVSDPCGKRPAGRASGARSSANR